MAKLSEYDKLLISDPAIQEAVTRAIRDGVERAFAGALADIDLKQVIGEAVYEAFDLLYAGDIMTAITEGTRQALQK